MVNKRNASVLIAVVQACFFGLSTNVSAVQRKPAASVIRFKRGESSAIVKGKLSSRRLSQSFLIGAKAGQQLTTEVKAESSDGLNFANLTLFDPASKSVATDADNGITRIRLERTGNYRIELTPPGSFYNEKLKGYKELQFTLFVRIQ